MRKVGCVMPLCVSRPSARQAPAAPACYLLPVCAVSVGQLAPCRGAARGLPLLPSHKLCAMPQAMARVVLAVICLSTS